MVRCIYACLMKFVNFDEFDEVVSRRMYINNNYVLYNGWKVGMLYIGMCVVCMVGSREQRKRRIF